MKYLSGNDIPIWTPDHDSCMTENSIRQWAWACEVREFEDVCIWHEAEGGWGVTIRHTWHKCYM